mmetsp:Transcript_5582/g.11060  ORF Transcript_5582/g.11060 Transcript_5582/m.11060 type:complete len:217 (-) Transcript_5582:561-1211(-)
MVGVPLLPFRISWRTVPIGQRGASGEFCTRRVLHEESLKPVPDPESWRVKVEGSRLPPCPPVCPDLDWVPLKPEVLLTSLPGPSRWAAVMGWKCRSWAVLPKSDPSSKERALLYNTLRLAESFENAENVRTGGYHAGTEATVEELIEKVTMFEPAQKQVDDTKAFGKKDTTSSQVLGGVPAPAVPPSMPSQAIGGGPAPAVPPSTPSQVLGGRKSK